MCESLLLDWSKRSVALAGAQADAEPDTPCRLEAKYAIVTNPEVTDLLKEQGVDRGLGGKGQQAVSALLAWHCMGRHLLKACRICCRTSCWMLL